MVTEVPKKFISPKYNEPPTVEFRNSIDNNINMALKVLQSP
jgi:hypothetical protein